MGDSDIPFRPREREIFNLLHSHINEYVHIDKIIATLHTGEEPDGAESTIRSHISRMRKYIKINSKWGQGYCLPINYRNGQ